MSASLFRFGILSGMLLLSSCIPAVNRSEIKQATAFETFETAPKKTFLLAYTDEILSRKFQESYMQTIAAEFNKIGSTVVTTRLTGLELDKNSHVRQMKDFQPDAVMVMHFNLRRNYNDLYTGSIALSLADYPGRNEIWKGVQTFEVSGGPSSVHGIEFAKEVFQNLLDERVLPGAEKAE